MDTARALTDNLTDLLRREHAALGEFLVALADFDQRRLWVDLGYSSVFYFLHRELRLSKAAAQYRKVAAELLQRIPAVVEPLRDGRLCLTSVIEAAKVVTPENFGTVLPRFFGLSRREAMEIVAELQPHPAPPRRTVVTSPRTAPARVSSAAGLAADAPAGLCAKVAAGSPEELTLSETRTAPARVASAVCLTANAPAGPCAEVAAGSSDELTLSETTVPRGATGGSQGAAGSPDELTLGEVTRAPAAVARPAEIVPLTAQERRFHVTVSARFLRKLEEAAAALSHSHPGATSDVILEAGLDLLLAQAEKRKGVVERPRKAPRAAKADHIPAHVKRAVWARDGGKCQWPLASGGICGCTRRLQFDHIQPLALGGKSTVENVRILCRSHNLLAARLAFGDEWMNRYTRAPRGPVPTTRRRQAPSS